MPATITVGGSSSSSISLGLPTNLLESCHLDPANFHKQFLGDTRSIAFHRQQQPRGLTPPPPLPEEKKKKKKRFVGNGPTVFSPLPNWLPLYSFQPQGRNTFSSLLDSGSKWWRKKKKTTPHHQIPREDFNASFLSPHLLNQQNQGRFFKAGAWIALLLLMGGSARYGQAKARAYMEEKLLPPLASIVGSYLGREVELGNIQRLSPLSFTLGPSSVGPHAEEFSCGELPGIEIRVRPLVSLQRGQVVINAVVTNPHVLVAQKEDWSWLGIPTPSEKKFLHQSSEPGLDKRTKLRRVSREEMGASLLQERDVAARSAARSGYVMGGGVDVGSKLDESSGSSGTLKCIAEGESEGEEEHQVGQAMRGMEKDAIVSGEQETFHPGLEDDELEEEPTLVMEVKSSVLKAKNWTETRVLRPVRRKLLRIWSTKQPPILTKAEYQTRNLQRSALAARTMFEKLERERWQKSGLVVHSGQEATPSGSMSRTAITQEENLQRLSEVSSGSEREKGHSDDSTTVGAKTIKQGSKVQTAGPKASTPMEVNGIRVSQFNDLWGNLSSETEVVGQGLRRRVKAIIRRLVRLAKRRVEVSQAEGWTPIALESVYFKDGTFTLLAYGDQEARVMERVNGFVKLRNNHQQILVHVTGKPKRWRSRVSEEGGRLFVKVAVDLAQQSWDVKVKGYDLFAPLIERLLELPLEWSNGRAFGEVDIWMTKEDTFPHFGGRVDVKGLDFRIMDAPSSFKGVSGTLFFQGQRLFFHNATGYYGAIPLNVSGDIDLNPEDGEYRLSCQVSGVECNSLMRSLGALAPPLPLAGSLKGVVYCRGPLDCPIFEGSIETTGKNMSLTYDTQPSAAVDAIQKNTEKGAVAAYDHVPFTSASASFTFNSDNCMADLYGLRAVPVGGGEIRGAGNLWICPEGEIDPTAVNVDCSGQVLGDALASFYAPAGIEVPPSSFGTTELEAKIRGAILMPVFDIKWATPEAQGAMYDGHGNIHISREAIVLNSSAFTFELLTKIHTSYPPINPNRKRSFEFKPAAPPKIEGLDVDCRLNGFDIMGLTPLSIEASSPSPHAMRMKVFGKLKFNGRVPHISSNNPRMEESQEKGIPGMVGDVSLVGLKLNQFLFAPHLTGSLDISPSSLKLHASGRADEHLHIHVTDPAQNGVGVSLGGQGSSSSSAILNKGFNKEASFSLQRGQLLTDVHYQPGHSAKLEIRNLQLDELELGSLRGAIPKADLTLNLLKRRGQGSLSVKQPRFSGLQGKSLDLAARWSGDVVTLEKSVLEQANSQYEVQGEYVLRGQRAGEKERDEEVMWEKAMAGQLGTFITSMGRWRLRLDVPHAEVSEMLPVARLLSRSSDPAVVSRSKELFLQGVQTAGFSAENLKELLECIRRSKEGSTSDEGSPESIPLPGLAELKGQWHGTLEATGGGKGDTAADFDLQGNNWEWGAYRTQRVIAVGDYTNNDGLRIEKFFIQKDTATLHADGTLLGQKPSLHFAVLNFPVSLVPPLFHAIQSSTPEPLPSPSPPTPIRGTLYMEGDLRGHMIKPQCDVQIRLLDGAIGGISLGRAEVAASITSANRLAFNAVFEPAAHNGHVRFRGSLPMGPGGALEKLEEDLEEDQMWDREKHRRTRGWSREKNWDKEGDDADEKTGDVSEKTGIEEGWEVRLAESLKVLDGDFLDSSAVQIDAAVKDGGMMLLTAVSPGLCWLQGNADVTLQVRGTVQQPIADGVADFHKVSISSPVLPRPLSNLGGTIRVKNNQLCVEGLEGRVGRRGHLEVRGQLPIKANEAYTNGDAIEIKAQSLEVRARHTFSGQVDTQVRLMGSLLDPEVTGTIQLSHGEAYLSQEKGLEKGASSPPSTISTTMPGGGYSWMAAAENIARSHTAEVFALPAHHLITKPSVVKSANVRIVDSVFPAEETPVEEGKGRSIQPPVAVRLRGLKLQLGPELRMVYPLILNFAVSGELELNGFADPLRVKPKGTLTFENGDVNLVATQVRLNRDHPNRAKFEPDQGFDPSLDLALVGADWQVKVQGLASNWQDNLVVTSNRTGEQDALTRIEAARVFESQLADSLLEGDGQLAFKKLAAATVETLMPKIETKGEFGQARWRLVSAPQIPNLLSLDPTTDPFKSLANLSFGAEVEVQLGRHLQASVVRQLKESEMATQWTLCYQLNSKLRILFSSIPSVDNRLLIEYSATSQN